MARTSWSVGRRRGWKITAANGAAEVLALPDRYTDLSVTLHPGAGGTCGLDVSCASPAEVGGIDADWVPVQFGASGDVSEDAGQALDAGLTGLRLRAVGAAASCRVALFIRGI